MTNTGAQTLPALFAQQVARQGDRLAIRFKEYGVWHRVSWRQYGEQVDTVAAALLAFGLRPQENVAVLGENRPEWLYCHLRHLSHLGARADPVPAQPLGIPPPLRRERGAARQDAHGPR